MNKGVEAGAPFTGDVPHLQAVTTGFFWFSSLPPGKWWANTSDHMHFHPNPFHCIIHRAYHSVHSDSINCKPLPVECIGPSILSRVLDTHHRTSGVKFLFYNTLTTLYLKKRAASTFQNDDKFGCVNLHQRQVHRFSDNTSANEYMYKI